MHIVFVTTELATAKHPSGGLASFTANMARIFTASGHKVTILLSSVKEQDLEFDSGIGLEITYVRKSIWNILNRISKICIWEKDVAESTRFLVNIYRSGQIKKKIKKINRKEKVDIVHYCNLSSLAFRKNRNIPYLIRISGLGFTGRATNMHDGNIKYEDYALSSTEKLMISTMKKARYIISPSYKYADIIKQKFNMEATVIESPYVLKKHNWNYDCFDQFMLRTKKYVIHYASILRYLKGTYVVAELVKELLANHSELYLVLAGECNDMQDKDGNYIKAHELVNKNAGEYANRVIYVGKVVREQLYPLIQNAEVCILPSRLENLSNACIEAMAMGKIVVATDGGSYEQLIDNKVNGFLCERDNPKSFLQGIEAALALNEEEKRSMESRAVEITKRLSPDIIYKQYFDFYESIIREW